MMHKTAQLYAPAIHMKRIDGHSEQKQMMNSDHLRSRDGLLHVVDGFKLT